MIRTTLAPGAPWPYTPDMPVPKPIPTANRVMELLQKGEYTSREVASALGIKYDAALGYLHRLHREGKAIRWNTSNRAANVQVQYAYTWHTNKPPETNTRKFLEATAQKLLPHLIYGTMNCSDLAAATGMHYATVLFYTRELHVQKRVYICGYEHDTAGRDNVKLYKLGQGTDAKRRKVSEAAKAKAYRARIAGKNNEFAGAAA